VTTGARGVGARGSGAPAGSDAGSGSAIGALARAPSVASTRSPPRRGAADPQRAWRAASASEMSDAGAIGRPIIERLFYSSRGETPLPGTRWRVGSSRDSPRFQIREWDRDLGLGIDGIAGQLLVAHPEMTPG
jgi:hypothetical protein